MRVLRGNFREPEAVLEFPKGSLKTVSFPVTRHFFPVRRWNDPECARGCVSARARAEVTDVLRGCALRNCYTEYSPALSVSRLFIDGSEAGDFQEQDARDRSRR